MRPGSPTTTRPEGVETRGDPVSPNQPHGTREGQPLEGTSAAKQPHRTAATARPPSTPAPPARPPSTPATPARRPSTPRPVARNNGPRRLRNRRSEAVRAGPEAGVQAVQQLGEMGVADGLEESRGVAPMGVRPGAVLEKKAWYWCGFSFSPKGAPRGSVQSEKSRGASGHPCRTPRSMGISPM